MTGCEGEQVALLLYIDFDQVWLAVCTPSQGWYNKIGRKTQVFLCSDGSGLCIRGTEVKLKRLELSQIFLGYDRDRSLLESDCVILGFVNSRG